MIKLFLLFQLRAFTAYFKTRSVAKLLTTLLFLVVFFFVGVLVYFFFLSGFRYINAEIVEDIQLALGLFLYEIFFLVLSVIIALSALVSGLFGLFKSSNNAWIISSPKYYTLPFISLWKTTLSSFLISLVIFIPALYAFVKVFNAPLFGIVLIIFSLFLLLLFINTMTTTLVIIVGVLYKYLTTLFKKIPFTFGGLILVSVLLVSSFVYIIWKTIRDVKLISIFRADTVTDTLHITVISEHFQLLPTHLLAKMMLSLQEGSLVFSFWYVLLFFILTGTMLVVFFFLSKVVYPLWQQFQETKNITSLFSFFKKKSYLFTGEGIILIIKKELLVSSRNMRSLTWLTFLLAIWLMQIGANVIIGHNIERYEPSITAKTTLLQTIQFGIALYFISAFTLRFAFPSFSSEKKTSWILGCAPISLPKLLYGKYFFFVVLFTLIGLIMQYINSFVLKLDMTHTLFSTIFLGISSVMIVTLGITFGIVFPNKDSDDPESASTSMSGIFFTILSLLYSGISSLLLYKISSFHANAFLYVCIWLLFSIFSIFFLLRIAKRYSYKVFLR